jgi:hypothetical protein
MLVRRGLAEQTKGQLKFHVGDIGPLQLFCKVSDTVLTSQCLGGHFCRGQPLYAEFVLAMVYAYVRSRTGWENWGIAFRFSM